MSSKSAMVRHHGMFVRMMILTLEPSNRPKISAVHRLPTRTTFLFLRLVYVSKYDVITSPSMNQLMSMVFVEGSHDEGTCSPITCKALSPRS